MKKICFVFLLLLTLIPLGVSAQQQMIQGRVLDDKGESIIGASVSVRGTVTGGITNLDGEFSVAGKVGDMLTISYIGYTPLEVKITKLTGNVYTLKEMLYAATEALKPGGRLVVITYHSLEDRMVKNIMKTGNIEGKAEKDFFGNVQTPFRLVNNKVIVPDNDEIERNPRSRSAKLRIAEKL